jgi:hypothetical protein
MYATDAVKYPAFAITVIVLHVMLAIDTLRPLFDNPLRLKLSLLHS